MTVEKYVDAIRRHSRALEFGNSKIANDIYAELRHILSVLKSNPPGLAVLRPLLQSDEIEVRSTAAAHLLGTFEQEAINVLEEVAKEKSLVGFEAKMTLKEWKAGRMSPP